MSEQKPHVLTAFFTLAIVMFTFGVATTYVGFARTETRTATTGIPCELVRTWDMQGVETNIFVNQTGTYAFTFGLGSILLHGLNASQIPTGHALFLQANVTTYHASVTTPDDACLYLANVMTRQNPQLNSWILIDEVTGKVWRGNG